MITSPQNPRVKDLVRLRSGGAFRRQRQRFLVEGRAAVAAAFASGAPVLELLYAPDLLGREHPLLECASRQGIEPVAFSPACFRKIADTRAPQGIAAVVGMTPPRLEVLERPDALVVACCSVADPGNLGTIIRTADAAGATAVVTLGRCVSPYNAKVVRATAGSLFHIPVLALDTEAFLAGAGASGLRILAATPAGETIYTQADWSRPVCVAVGSEAHGLPALIARAAAGRVRIPIRGGAESLNAAVAAALLLYEATRDR